MYLHRLGSHETETGVAVEAPTGGIAESMRKAVGKVFCMHMHAELGRAMETDRQRTVTWITAVHIAAQPCT